jgi:predicted nucleotidyltransferase
VDARPRDLFATLVRRRHDARVREQVRAEDLCAKAHACAVALRARRAIDGAWLIGSLAWGGHGAHSDVDVVVCGVASDALTAVAAALAERLGDDVDVLRLEALPESFRRRVLEKGVRLDEP